tara:strand:- start:152 stop:493 length:342 start_codon:yes stop_codon:yes gene_type:complete
MNNFPTTDATTIHGSLMKFHFLPNMDGHLICKLNFGDFHLHICKYNPDNEHYTVSLRTPITGYSINHPLIGEWDSYGESWEPCDEISITFSKLEILVLELMQRLGKHDEPKHV